ncbi:MAG TPA: flagellar biosynthesis protein FlgJ [Alphaproteobacteria bacterium]
MSINETNVSTSALPAKWAAASADVVKAIRQASAKTGVSFDYLMDKASTESSFKTDIKAKTSSATGLFQFIDSTWLQTIKEHGAKYGLGDLVDKIDSDPAAKRQALELRKDPEVAATMTAEATKDNQYYLETSVGGKIGQNELYLAHFLGAGGASKFLNAKNNNGEAPAADIFPQAAKANKNVFYEASGKKRSLNDVYDFFAKKMDSDGSDSVMTASTMSPMAPKVDKPVAPTMSPIDYDMMARLGGARLPNVATGYETASNWTSAFTGTQDFTATENRFVQMALGGFSNDAEKGGHEGKLLAPFTAVILAKLSALRETDEQKS